MGKKGPLWWRESDWLLRGSSAANQILLRHSGPILSNVSLSLYRIPVVVLIARIKITAMINVLPMKYILASNF